MHINLKEVNTKRPYYSHSTTEEITFHYVGRVPNRQFCLNHSVVVLDAFYFFKPRLYKSLRKSEMELRSGKLLKAMLLNVIKVSDTSKAIMNLAGPPDWNDQKY